MFPYFHSPSFPFVVSSPMFFISSFLFLSLLTSVEPILPGQEAKQPNSTVPPPASVWFDPTHLDLFFFHTAVSSLLKAKARSILEALPPVEGVVFGQCKNEAKGRLNHLARCLVALFNTRDAHVANSTGTARDGDGAELPWHSVMSRYWTNELAPKNGGMDGQNGSDNMELGGSRPSKVAKNLAMFKAKLDGKKASGLKEALKRKRKRVFKREVADHNRTDERLKQYPHVRKLFRVEHFYRVVDKCQAYIRRKDAENSAFLRDASLPCRLETRLAERSPLFGVAEQQLRDSVLSSESVSVLSPNLFSVVPDVGSSRLGEGGANSTLNQTQKSASPLPDLLSPTLFSFHEQGELSLPSLLKSAFSNGDETLLWLNLLLELSGAAQTLDRLTEGLEQKIDEVERKIYPAIQLLEEMERRFERVKRSQSERQRDQMERRGYTFLSAEQGRMLGLEVEDGSGSMAIGDEEEELDRVLEEDIRTIAQMGDEHLNGGSSGIGEGSSHRRRKRFLRTEKFGQVRMLNPYLFANQVHDHAVLRRVAVSPKAFSGQLISADFGLVDVLSPDAFTASLLSPRAAIVHILSPGAFRARALSPQAFVADVLGPLAFEAKLLSPRAFATYVLSPRAFITDILSPKALELRVLTPLAIGFNVLSPNVGVLKFASPSNLVTVVLSPSILSPSFLAGSERGNVHILSPSILSGGG